MGFGDWFKKLKKGAEKVIKKVQEVAPVVLDRVQQGAQWIGDNAVKIGSTIGNAIGGQIGDKINRAAGQIENLGNNVNRYTQLVGNAIRPL